MNKIILFFFSIFFYFIFLLPAYAYLDPGTISIVLQSILAAIAGIVATTFTNPIDIIRTRL